MKYLLQVANVIAQKNRDETLKKLSRDHEAEIEGEITTLRDEDIEKILDTIFYKEIPSDSNFYDLVEEVEYYIGFKPLSTKLIADLWVKAYLRLSPDNQIFLLQSLLDENIKGFWTAIRSLPRFCSCIELDPSFATIWFFELANKVKGDFFAGDVFKAIGKFAFHFPKSGLKIFENFISEDLDDLKLSLAAVLLGTVRSRASQGHIGRESVKEWDDHLQNNLNTVSRLCYHRSLTTTFNLGTLSISELDNKLSKMLDGNREEIGEAFNTVYHCLLGRLSDDSFIKFALGWFSTNASSQIPDLAKYCIVDSMWRLCRYREAEPKLIDSTEANNLLVAIQPIPNDNLGTWHQLEFYLVDRLHEGLVVFEDAFMRIYDANAEGFLALLQEDGLNYLKSEMGKSNIGELVTKCIISPKHGKRMIGNTLFKQLKLTTLSQEVLSSADESQLNVALLEFTRQPSLGENTSSYLLLMEPIFRQVRPEIQEVLKNEMVIQAINYPGACFEEWKKIPNPSHLLKDVIKIAEEYFKNLNESKGLSAISFSFTGYIKAIEKNFQEFSSQVNRLTHEKSIFFKLAKNVEIIYGSRWSIYMEGNLGEDTSFSEFSSSMEFPRLEIIDPEGMALRRIKAAAKIRELNDRNVF